MQRLAIPRARLNQHFPNEKLDVDIQLMQAKIGELTLENDFLEKALTKVGRLSARR